MDNFMSIFKKELYRFFSDKRMIITTLILPAMLIFFMYSLMGEGISKIEEVDEDYESIIFAHNMPQIFYDEYDIAKICNSTITEVDCEEIDTIKSKIKNKEADLMIVFEPDFMNSIMVYNNHMVPQIEIYYNSSDENSLNTFNKYSNFFLSFEATVANVFDINSEGENYDLASDEDIVSSLLATFIPMMVILILFNSCLSVSAESLAGEKERGTMATLLATPISRRAFAIGKVCSLSFISLLSGISSFIGIILALPKILSHDDTQIGVDIYSVFDYISILITIASAVIVIVAVISLISAYAKNAKEATSMTTPLTIVATLTGMLPLLLDVQFDNVKWHLIPVFNNVLCLNKILSYNFLPFELIVTVVSNFTIASILVFVLSKVIDSEKIIFSK